MRYHHLEGVKSKGGSRHSTVTLSVLAFLLFASGGYLLVNTFAPTIPLLAASGPVTEQTLRTTSPKPTENRIYIPSINVDIKIVEIKDYETELSALDHGAIHRAPDNGSPKDGGNFVVAAHRFNLGLTPKETLAKSPFYNIDKLQNGQQIFVDWEGTRYAYEVSKRYLVPADAISIENRSEQPILTLYSCELEGPEAGREVIEAHPIGTVIVQDGKQVIQNNN